MKTIILTLAIFILHSKVGYAKPNGSDENEDENVLSTITKSLEEETNCKRQKLPKDSISLPQQSFNKQIQLNAEKKAVNMKVRNLERWLAKKVASLSGQSKAKFMKRKPLEGVKDLSGFDGDDDERNKRFPQSFESLFASKLQRDEMAVNEKRRAEEDLLKIAADLKELDWLNIDGERRNSKRLNDEERPPRPG